MEIFGMYLYAKMKVEIFCHKMEDVSREYKIYMNTFCNPNSLLTLRTQNNKILTCRKWYDIVNFDKFNIICLNIIHIFDIIQYYMLRSENSLASHDNFISFQQITFIINQTQISSQLLLSASSLQFFMFLF